MLLSSQAQSKALNSKDMANFFTSMVTLDVCIEALLKDLVKCARSVSWSENIAVGEAVIDNIKNQRIESTLQVYATCLAPTRHTLVSSTFAAFVAGLESKLGMKTLPQHLESVFSDVKRRQEVIRLRDIDVHPNSVLTRLARFALLLRSF